MNKEKRYKDYEIDDESVSEILSAVHNFIDEHFQCYTDIEGREKAVQVAIDKLRRYKNSLAKSYCPMCENYFEFDCNKDEEGFNEYGFCSFCMTTLKDILDKKGKVIVSR